MTSPAVAPIEHESVGDLYTQTLHRSSYPAIDPTNPKNSAAGKVVVVTGGGTGVGKGIAGAFVAAGAKAVAILGRRDDVLQAAKRELEAAGTSQILALAADVTDEVALNAAFASVAQQAGPIDIAVGNAGYLSTPGLAITSDVEDWFKAYEINVKGSLLTFRAWLPHKSEHAPTFLSVNTGAAHFGAFPGISSYSSSKLAEARLMVFLQTENPGVRVASFHPGVIPTDMVAKFGAQPMPFDDISLPSSFAVWLASPAADWTGGRFLWAAWDVEELAQMKTGILKNNELQMGLIGWPKQAGK